MSKPGLEVLMRAKRDLLAEKEQLEKSFEGEKEELRARFEKDIADLEREIAGLDATIKRKSEVGEIPDRRQPTAAQEEVAQELMVVNASGGGVSPTIHPNTYKGWRIYEAVRDYLKMHDGGPVYVSPMLNDLKAAGLQKGARHGKFSKLTPKALRGAINQPLRKLKFIEYDDDTDTVRLINSGSDNPPPSAAPKPMSVVAPKKNSKIPRKPRKLSPKSIRIRKEISDEKYSYAEIGVRYGVTRSWVQQQAEMMAQEAARDGEGERTGTK